MVVKGQVPLSMFSGVRWTEASSCPLSHVYGQPGDRFILVEAIATQGTGKRVFRGLGWDGIVGGKGGGGVRPQCTHLKWVDEGHRSVDVYTP